MKKTFKTALSTPLLLTAAALTQIGCGGQFGQIGASILSSTGYVSASEANTLMKAGEGIAKGLKSLSPEEEHYLGRGVAATILAKYKPYRNAEITSYVNKIAAVVVAVSDKPETFGGYHVLILDSNEINAVSAPGGFIFVTKGFLKLVPNEEALAGVIAHEVGHIVKGHGMRAISEANLSQSLILLGKQAAESRAGGVVSGLTTAFGDSVSDVASTLLTKGYSRSQEYEADEYAHELLKRSGYSTGGIVEMLTAVKNSSQSKDGGGWGSTHPSAEDRLDELDSEDSKSGSAASAIAARTARFNQVMKRLG